MTDSEPTSAGAWGPPPHTPDLDAYDAARWRDLTARVARIAGERDWSKHDVARESGVPVGTLSQWYDGNYAGNVPNVSGRVEKWLASAAGNGAADAPAPVAGPADDYERWAAPRHAPALGDAELARWRRLAAAVADTAERYRWSKSEVSRRSGVPSGTLSQWYDGNYKGRYDQVSTRIERWLESVEELAAAAATVPATPGFVATPTAAELTGTLLYAQMMPEMVVVTLGAGMGKTMTACHFRDSRPHAYLVTMRPTTSSVHGMLKEFAEELGVNERNPAKLDRALGQKLRRNGRNTLLIVDEAQHLIDDAVNQLRYFLDVYGVGLALLGNEELYGRFGGAKNTPAYAQINRRIGKRLRRLRPLPGDIDALIDAWGLTDPESRKIAQAIGRKPGALSQIGKTLQLAGMYAAGDGRPLDAEHIKAAWRNRGAEEA